MLPKSFAFSDDDEESSCSIPEDDVESPPLDNDPIKISTCSSIKVELPCLVWNNYDNLPNSLTLTNTGSSVSVTGIWCGGKPYVSGGPLNGIYVFSQIHFHWPSEHSLNEVRYPLEVHAVHYKATYMTEEKAMKERDGTIVLVYFFEVVKGETTVMSNITKNLCEIRKKNGKTQISNCSLENFIKPFSSNYFIYSGTANLGDATYYLQWIISCSKLRISEQELCDLKEFFRDGEGERPKKSKECNPFLGGLFFVKEISVRSAKGCSSENQFSDNYPSEPEEIGDRSFKSRDQRKTTKSAFFGRSKKKSSPRESSKSEDSLCYKSSSCQYSSDIRQTKEKSTQYSEDLTVDSATDDDQTDAVATCWTSNSSNLSDSDQSKRKFICKFGLLRKSQNNGEQSDVHPTKTKKKKPANRKSSWSLFSTSASEDDGDVDGEKCKVTCGNVEVSHDDSDKNQILTTECDITCSTDVMDFATQNCVNECEEKGKKCKEKCLKNIKNIKDKNKDNDRDKDKDTDTDKTTEEVFCPIAEAAAENKETKEEKPKKIGSKVKSSTSVRESKGKPGNAAWKTEPKDQHASVKWDDQVEVRFINDEKSKQTARKRPPDRPLRNIKEEPKNSPKAKESKTSLKSKDKGKIKEDAEMKRDYVVAPATVTDSTLLFKSIGTMTTLSLLPVPGEVGVESNTSGTRILVVDGKLLQTEEENGGPQKRDQGILTSENWLKSPVLPKEQLHKPKKKLEDASTSTDDTERVLGSTSFGTLFSKTSVDPSPGNTVNGIITSSTASQTLNRKDQSLASIFTAVSEDPSLTNILGRISGAGSHSSSSPLMSMIGKRSHEVKGKPLDLSVQTDLCTSSPMSLHSKKTEMYNRLARAASEVSRELHLMESMYGKESKLKEPFRDQSTAMKNKPSARLFLKHFDIDYEPPKEKMDNALLEETIINGEKLPSEYLPLRSHTCSNEHTLVNFLVKLSKEPSLAADLATFLSSSKPRKSRKEESLSSILTKVAKDPSFATELAIILSESSLEEILPVVSCAKLPENNFLLDTETIATDIIGEQEISHELLSSAPGKISPSDMTFNISEPTQEINKEFPISTQDAEPVIEIQEKTPEFLSHLSVSENSSMSTDKVISIWDELTGDASEKPPGDSMSLEQSLVGESSQEKNASKSCVPGANSITKKSIVDILNEIIEKSFEEFKRRFPATEISEGVSAEKLLAADFASLLKEHSILRLVETGIEEQPVVAEESSKSVKEKSLLDILRSVSREPSLASDLVNVLKERSSMKFKEVEKKHSQGREESFMYIVNEPMQNRSPTEIPTNLLRAPSLTSDLTKSEEQERENLHGTEDKEANESRGSPTNGSLAETLNTESKINSSAEDFEKLRVSLRSIGDKKTDSKPSSIDAMKCILNECFVEILGRVSGEPSLISYLTKASKHQSVASILDRSSRHTTDASVFSGIRKQISLPEDLGKAENENRASLNNYYELVTKAPTLTNEEKAKTPQAEPNAESEEDRRRLQSRVNFEAKIPQSDVDTERPEVETLHRQEDLNESIKSRRSTETRRSGDDEMSLDLHKKSAAKDGSHSGIPSESNTIPSKRFFDEYYLTVEGEESFEENSKSFNSTDVTSTENVVELRLCPMMSITAEDHKTEMEDCTVRLDIEENSEEVCIETRFLVKSRSFPMRSTASNQLNYDPSMKARDGQDVKAQSSTSMKNHLLLYSENMEIDPETGKKATVGQFVKDH